MGKVFEQIVGIPTDTNCAPLLANIFLYSYETVYSLYSWSERNRYIVDVLSINNPDFEDYRGSWDQRHDREQHFCFLLRLDRVGRSTSHFPLQQARRFQFPNHKLSVPEYHNPIFACLWHLSRNQSDTPSLAPLMNVLFWGQSDFQIRFFGKNISRNVWNRLLWSTMGWYQDLIRQLSPSLQIVTCNSGGWSYALTTSIDQTLHQCVTLSPKWTLLPYLTFNHIEWGFNRTFTMGVAFQQRTLTPLDTWSCPTLGLYAF